MSSCTLALVPWVLQQKIGAFFFIVAMMAPNMEPRQVLLMLDRTALVSSNVLSVIL
jgi:hypothetical protein